jgi:hypothetical protein
MEKAHYSGLGNSYTDDYEDDSDYVEHCIPPTSQQKNEHVSSSHPPA